VPNAKIHTLLRTLNYKAHFQFLKKLKFSKRALWSGQYGKVSRSCM